MNFGESLAQQIKQCIDLRRQRGASVAWTDVQPEIANLANRLINAGPREMAECPICSQPPKDKRYPQFWLAHRSTHKHQDSRWLLVGCAHAHAINFTPVMSDQDVDEFELKWREEVKVLFEKHTESWTPEQKSHRANVLQLT